MSSTQYTSTKVQTSVNRITLREARRQRRAQDLIHHTRQILRLLAQQREDTVRFAKRMRIERLERAFDTELRKLCLR